MQNFRGLYQGSFIVQTFGEHFSAINSTQNIPGVHDQNAKPCQALALLITVVCNLFLHQDFSQYACRLSMH